jgi:gas vesicle protein
MYKSVAGFLVGGLIAGAVALLYAPQSGEETRRDIKENVLEAKQKASLAIGDAKERMMVSMEEVQGKAQTMLENVSQEVQTRTGRSKEASSKMIDEQSSRLEHGIEQASEALSS